MCAITKVAILKGVCMSGCGAPTEPQPNPQMWSGVWRHLELHHAEMWPLILHKHMVVGGGGGAGTNLCLPEAQFAASLANDPILRTQFPCGALRHAIA